MTPARPRVEPMLWIIAVAVLAMVLGSGIHTNVTLRSVEQTLPTTLLAQLEDLTRIMEHMSELVNSSDPNRGSPTPDSIDLLLKDIEVLFTKLVNLRNTYVFDNLIQASAFHAVVAPALVDAREWLTRGVSGHAPESSLTMRIVHARLHDARRKASIVRYESHAAARDVLLEQRHRLERFLSGVNLLLFLALAAALMVLGLTLRQLRLARREAMVQAERERLTIIIESTNDMVSTFTPDGALTFLNTAGRKLLGWEGEENLNTKVISDIHPLREAKNILAVGIPTAVRRGSWSGETALLNAHGIEIPVVQTIMSHRTPDGQVEYLSSIIHDISDRKRAEQERESLQIQLLQAQKMEALGTLAGGVAHDFNNLLQAIGGCTQALLKNADRHNPEHAKLKTIERTVDRAAQLVRRLLLFSRRAEAQRIPVNLNQALLDAATILEQTIPRMISLTMNLNEQLWPVLADPAQIEQMLLNLGSNAADAMPDGGRLVLETRNMSLDDETAGERMGLPPGPYVVLSVSDTGCGMDKPTLEKIFDPFFTTKEVGKGTGLGMASVYGIVQDHGGMIACSSELDRGTAFTIYFPAMPDQEATKTLASATEAPCGKQTGTETILVVDDEADLLELTAEALRNAGYATLEAKSGEQALEAFRLHREVIDLILLDLNMPGMGGQRCLKELQRLDPAARVLIVSGYVLNDQVKQAMDSGASGFLGKPFQIDELLLQIRQILDRRE
ncbi:MAG TPA: response regulator [Desulfonatronum sp.]|nr:response regulator [Desulfonatronum sp.]